MSSFTNELGKNIIEIATNDDSLQDLDESSSSCEDIIPQECLEDEETSSMSQESDIHEPLIVQYQEPAVVCINDKSVQQKTNIKPDSVQKNNTIINTGYPPIQVCVHPLNTGNQQQSKMNIPVKPTPIPKLFENPLPTSSTKKCVCNTEKTLRQSVQQQIMKKPLEQKKVKFDNSKLATTIPLSPKLSNTQIAQVAQSALQRATKAFHMPVSTFYFFIALLCIGICFYLYQRYVAKPHQTQ